MKLCRVCIIIVIADRIILLGIFNQLIFCNHLIFASKNDAVSDYDNESWMRIRHCGKDLMSIVKKFKKKQPSLLIRPLISMFCNWPQGPTKFVLTIRHQVIDIQKFDDRKYPRCGIQVIYQTLLKLLPNPVEQSQGTQVPRLLPSQKSQSLKEQLGDLLRYPAQIGAPLI